MSGSAGDLLHDPSLNKATAFTEAERQALGLVGFVPDSTDGGRILGLGDLGANGMGIRSARSNSTPPPPCHRTC